MSIEGAKPVKLHYWNSSTNKWEKWDGVLSTGDLSIGAVELKDGDSNTRADIESDGTKNALFVQANDLDIRNLTSTDVVTVTGGVGQVADVKITLDSESVAVTGTFWQATQPVSGTVTANAGTNLNTSALALESGGNLATIAGDTTSIDGKTPALGQALAAGSVPVVLTAAQITTLTPQTDALTDTQLRATAVPVQADTELSTAAVLANNEAVPTTSRIGAYLYALNGLGNGEILNTVTNVFNHSSEGLLASALVAQFDDTTPTTISEGNWGNLRISPERHLYTEIRDAAGNERGLNISSGGNISIDTLTTLTGGGIAHDGVDSGNPLKFGFIAYSPDGTTPGTAVAELDRSNAKGDLDGRQFVNAAHPRSGHKHLDGTAAYTDESLVADPGDGFQIIITSIIFSSGEAIAINFFLEEGSTKIFGPIYIEATAGRGFVSGPIRLPVTASTAVTLTTSAANDQSFDMDYFIQAV